MIAWFICKYRRRIGAPRPTRYCSMNDYTTQIRADGGAWTETEVLGNHAIVKVLANTDTLQTIANDPDFIRLPKDRLDDSLSDLGTTAKNTIRNKILELGYSLSEIQERFGNDIGDYTLKDVLLFVAKRRLKPRYDSNTDDIICDGIEQVVRPLNDVDKEIQ